MNFVRYFLSTILIFSLASNQIQHTSYFWPQYFQQSKEGFFFKDKEFESIVGVYVGVYVGIVIAACIAMYAGEKIFQKIHSFKILKPDEIQENWKTIIGQQQAKKSLQDVIAYLKNPAFYAERNMHIPHGILLIGDQGAEMALLARAMAGEANCCFVHVSGDDFQISDINAHKAPCWSAWRRIKQLFSQVRSQGWPLSQKSCIIFIDKFETIAGLRSIGYISEQNKGIIRLLQELDFLIENDVPVIVVGATNCPEKIDPAFMQGRISRVISVELPNQKEREEILKLYLKQMKYSSDAYAYVSCIAQRTSGFSKAQLAELIQIAARVTSEWSLYLIKPQALEEALEIMISGNRSNIVCSKQERIVTAYHEAGHALACMILDQNRAVKRVSIVPRENSLGITYFAAIQECQSVTKLDLLNQIAVCLGGRVAEEIQFNAITTGAHNDLKNAKNIAYKMLKDCGMGSKIVLTEQQIEEEITIIIQAEYERVKQVLLAYKSALDYFAELLLQYETLTEKELDSVNPLKNGTK